MAGDSGGLRHDGLARVSDGWWHHLTRLFTGLRPETLLDVIDLTALGRQEEWEEPKGRAPRVHGADPTFSD